jgi:hypothetical protein
MRDRRICGVLVALVVGACGSSPASDGDALGPPPDATPPTASDGGGIVRDASVTEACGEATPWTELAAPAIALRGVLGGAGGDLRLSSSGAIVLDPAAVPEPWPAVLEAPGGGTTLADTELPADVVHAGTLRLDGVTVTSGDGPRTIRVTGGDLVIAGTLQAGLDGGATQPLSIDVPDGSVFVEGTITTAPAAPNGGEHAGAITIRARRVVVRGDVLAPGACNDEGPGGDGGALAITATEGDVVLRDGRLGSHGGYSTWRGGRAGSIAITAAGSILLAGTIEAPGGDSIAAGSATSGAGGDLALSAGGDVQLLAATILRGGTGGDVTLDASGTIAIAAAIDARGGAAGGLVVGGAARPHEVLVLVPIALDGGDGAAAGGPAGGFVAETSGGGIRIALPVEALGGGATDPALAGPGGLGGDVMLRVTSHTGDVVVAAGGQVIADGGPSTGGAGGAAGHLDLRTVDGTLTLAGTFAARGGAAPAGTGGDGGPLHVHTDTDFDGVGGDITIEATGVIDVSGGAGATGGDARSNGRFGVEAFPEGVEELAVLLNSDSAPGAITDGVIENFGVIYARGGVANGSGGDVIYHGRDPSADIDPSPGQLFVDGDGTGEDGQYFMQ